MSHTTLSPSARSEVQEGLNKANALFTRWKESLDSTNTATNREYYDTKDILMQELLGLEEDVLELDKAIRTSGAPHCALAQCATRCI